MKVLLHFYISCLTVCILIQVKTTSPKKYSVRPNTGVVSPRSTCDVIGM
jgi:hypothetical protein